MNYWLVTFKRRTWRDIYNVPQVWASDWEECQEIWTINPVLIVDRSRREMQDFQRTRYTRGIEVEEIFLLTVTSFTNADFVLLNLDLWSVRHR